jgi:hypothetical protein
MKRIFIIPLLLVISVASFASETIKSFDVKLNDGNFSSIQKVVLNDNHATFSFIGRMYDIDVIQSDQSENEGICENFSQKDNVTQDFKNRY